MNLAQSRAADLVDGQSITVKIGRTATNEVSITLVEQGEDVVRILFSAEEANEIGDTLKTASRDAIVRRAGMAGSA
jgi:hypothetical protein